MKTSKMNLYMKILAALLIFNAASELVHAENETKRVEGLIKGTSWTPMQLGVFPKCQLFDSRTRVYGINCSPFVSLQREVIGIDMKLMGYTIESTGITVSGVALSCYNHGVMIGAMNWTGNSFVQAGLFNIAANGLQIGLINYNSHAPIPIMPVMNFSLKQAKEPDDFGCVEKEQNI